MTSQVGKPILVTGSHRSGSSWVGKMISLSSDVAYINEPFNIDHRPRVCSADFDYWFTYICKANEQAYRSSIADCIAFRYPLSSALASSGSARELLKLARDLSLTSWYRVSRKRPLVKDPIALFSTEWLAQTFDMDVITLIRHPAAFAGSLKSSHWTHPFDHFLQQPLLMEEHLAPFKAEIEAYAKTEHDIIDQAILLWNLIHHMILKYRTHHPEWQFVRHEDLSEDPIGEFKKIYDKLNLPFSDRIENTLRASTSPESVSRLKRDSKSNRWSWRERLSSEEIARIRDRTNETAKFFYSNEDWGDQG